MHLQPYISSIEDSVHLSEKSTDSLRLRRIQISGKMFFVSVFTDVFPKLRVHSKDLKLLYERDFSIECSVIDFDLMYDGEILIMIIEDCNTTFQ